MRKGTLILWPVWKTFTDPVLSIATSGGYAKDATRAPLLTWRILATQRSAVMHMSQLCDSAMFGVGGYKSDSYLRMNRLKRQTCLLAATDCCRPNQDVRQLTTE